MYKVAICGDIHWSTYSSILRRRCKKYSQRLEGLIKSVNWFEKLAKSNGCTEEIFLGDTFDRPDLSAEEMTALQDIKWNKLPKHFLVGNHESNINTLEYSSTKFFESIDADVIQKSKSISISDNIDFIFIPYIKTDIILKLSDFIENKDKRNIVFAHQDLAGMQYGKFLSQTGFSVDDIKDNCELFFDGHLHNENKIGNIYIVGILTGQNFNEDAFNFKHRAYILTIDNDEVVHVESFVNPEAFNFYKLKFENEDDLQKIDLLGDNAVVSAISEEKLIKRVSKGLKEHRNVLESRVTMFYSYDCSSEWNNQTILIDDYTKQFMLLAQSKFAQSAILDYELSRLEGD